MATSGPKLNATQLKAAFIKDLSAAWEYFRRRRPNYTPYAFVLYGVEDPIRLYPVVLTEEGLTQRAKWYVEKGHQETVDEARKSLRWSVADSPHILELNDQIPTVDALVEPHAESLYESGSYAPLANAAIAALKEMESQKIFGSELDREQLLLIVITFDTEEDWSQKSAKALNPKAVFKKFEDETRIEGEFRSCQALAISRDGRSLYGAGSVKNPNATGSNDEFISEVVAYDIRVTTLARRWTYSFPMRGDSGRALAVAPDDSSALVLRAKYADKVCHTLLMRFARDSNQALQQNHFLAEPVSFAVSADGTHIAVSGHDKTIHLFDANLKLLHKRVLDARPYGVLFLESGELLVGTDAAILSFDPATDAAPATFPIRSFRFRTDVKETLLVVSRWPDIFGPERDKPVEFGVQLLRLPSLELERSFLIPGHQAVRATISQDGAIVAFEAVNLAKGVGHPKRTFVAAFDVETGQEIARYYPHPNNVNDLLFVPDNRTLAIAISAITTSEPIVFWTVPEK